MPPHLPTSLAIITGSGQGLGKAFADKLLSEGAKVCLSDVRVETGERAVEEFAARFGRENVCFIPCDVTKLEDLVGLYEGCEAHFNKRVNIFCNNAGVNHAPGWRRCIEIDTMAVVAGTELVLDRMGQQAGGLIVNTASLAGILKGFNRESASYFVAKHGVVALTRSLGQEHLTRRSGVEHMAICPAFAETDILEDLGVKRETLEAKEGIMTPEYVADCFLKLVKTGHNGDIMIVRKNTPPFIYKDYSLPLVGALSVGARVVQKGLGGGIFTAKHQAGVLGFAFLVIILIAHAFLNLVFGK
eukprot:GFUD01002601.1.p1 GENE.GFUD01002601.1~~GFUD01002601.1.p1  ORF type:complete len:318 (-),score=90.92 GFUD01002601.1:17-919(-)